MKIIKGKGKPVNPVNKVSDKKYLDAPTEERYVNMVLDILRGANSTERFILMWHIEDAFLWCREKRDFDTSCLVDWDELMRKISARQGRVNKKMTIPTWMPEPVSRLRL